MTRPRNVSANVRRTFMSGAAQRLAEYRSRVIEALTQARTTNDPTEQAALFALAEAWSARARRLDTYLARLKKRGRKSV